MNAARIAVVLSTVCVVALVAPVAADDSAAKLGVAELHVVGLYEGVERTGDEIHGGRAKVTVSRPGVNVTLVLTSYSRITWKVVPTPETRIVEVVLGGYSPQAIKDIGPATKVTEAFRQEGKSGDYLTHVYKLDDPKFRGFVHQVASYSKLPISSFHGAYAYQHEKPITVSKVQEEPRLDRDFPKPSPAAELPDILFPGLHLVASDRRLGHAQKASWGDFKPSGPVKESLVPLPDGITQAVFDGKNKTYYGIRGHNVVKFGDDPKKFEQLDVGFAVPEFSWPQDLALDAKRERLFVLARNYLYQLDLASGAWSVLAERPGLVALTFSAKHDCLFGCSLQRGGDGPGKPTLVTMNLQGAPVNTRSLGDPVVPGSLNDHPFSGAQLIDADDYLVLITSPNDFSGESIGPPMSYTYLIEPKKGTTWLAAKRQVGGDEE
jgi:hypothetical protein